jgi:electron transfer flavoprotein alpha subunit
VSFIGDLGIAVIKAKSYDAAPEDNSRSGEIIDLTDSVGDISSRTKLVDRKKVESEGIRLEDAAIVVSGGRGLGGPEPFEKLQELANLLGGALGASRAACDAGWIPYAHQVGLTGKTVSADTYFAIAISGASQHLAGMTAVKNVIAINRDKEANIFKNANYGVVGDWEKITTAFLNMVKELS